ncbi:MAG: tectonin domain-containing protein [Nitrospiraceae bacterium]
MGWDGTLWAIDASGAPYLYDPTADAWLAHGDGIDAAASYNGTSYFFRGNQVLQITVSGAATLKTIAEVFPKVPDSFKLGVSGVAVVDKMLILFKGGRYVPTDGSTPPRKLVDLSIWPKTAPWQDGLFTGLYYDSTGVYFLNGDTYFGICDLYGVTIGIGPGPVSQFYNWAKVLPPSWLNTGIDAGLPTPSGFILFKGTHVAQFNESDNTPVTPAYLPAAYADWPAAWHPVLNQAPSGRVGNLWTVDKAQDVFQHDGAQWIQRFGKVQQVSVGQDDTVYHISSNAVDLYKWDGKEGWEHQATSAAPLAQIALGDENHIWVRDNTNQIHRYSSQDQTFMPVNLGAGVPNPTHMAATGDGTLWHCNSSNANAFRFISEATAASAAIPVQQGSVTGVQKVAGTGFGAAHCLVTQNGRPHVYRYDSPYVFKTSQPYVVSSNAPLAQGLGRLYFVQLVDHSMPGHLHVRFVALDAHTGQEVAGYIPAGDTTEYTGLVFDSINDLVYVGAAPLTDIDAYNNTTPGQLIALDARTLQIRWIYQTKAGIDGTPVLSGTQLCFGDRTGTVYMFDTRDALANAVAPTPRWIQTLTDWQGYQLPTTQRTATPVLRNGFVHAAAWGVWLPSDGSNTALARLIVVRCNAQDGGDNVIQGSTTASFPVVGDLGTLTSYAYAPVLGTAGFAGKAAPALFVAGGNAVYAVRLDQAESASFTLPSGRISSGFAYDDGTRAGTGLSSTGPLPDSTRLWFGDDQGNLWSLNGALQPMDGTPYNLVPHTEIRTTPVLYKDPQGGLTVLFGVTVPLNPSAETFNLYGYDPDNRNHAGVPTGVTGIWSLSAGVTNGVVYAAGGGSTTSDGQVSQVFGIRVDELPQALRDFIIESQLMQDPDPSAQGGSTDPNNPIPPSVARYQTHLTVVDDRKSPRPHEPVKIWADTPSTVITVDGRPFIIGPGDAEFASVTTGVDGSLVIVSNAADLFASPLRVWASFMDPYERIVVNPDQEFHARVTTAHANAGDDDPDKVNLQTAHNYNGASLFTDQEKSQGQPQNCADAVAQMNKGVGLSGGASRATFAKVMQAVTGNGSTAGVGDEAQPDKYLAYADLTGASHFPTNIPAVRPANVTAPMGLHFVRPQDDKSSPPALTAIHLTDALAAIDELPPTNPDAPWLTPSLGAQGDESRVIVGRAEDLFTNFWTWLRGAVQQAVAYITHIIVAVGEDIVVGIRLIVNGVEQVFKAVIKVIEDIAAAIGSFFQMLEKLIEDVIAALSVLFQFGEIMKTHRWMATEIMRLVNGDPNDRTNYPGFATTIQNVVIPAVNQGFAQGEAAIAGFLNSLEGQLQPGSHISDLQGQGSTPHTAYTVGPQGGQKSSKAVQCSWGTQKLKSGLLSSAPAGGLNAPRAPGGVDGPTDDLLAFLTNFLTSNNNDNLSSAFSGNFNPSPAGNFFDQALTGLLEAVKTLLTDALKVANDFIDGMLKNIAAVIDLLFNETTGFITAPIDFPIISWLYKTLFGEPLTILNLCTLVAAIPATMIYKVSTGRYPSQDLPGASAIDPSNAQAVDDAGAGAKQPQRAGLSTSQIIQVTQGIFGGVIAMALGIVRAFVDSCSDEPSWSDALPWLLKLQVALTILYPVSFFPLISNPDPTKTPWWGWTSWAVAITIALTGLVSLLPLKDALRKVVGKVMMFVRMGLGIVWLGFVTAEFILENPGRVSPTSGVAFGRNVALTLAPIVNPLKIVNGDGKVIVAVVDVAVGVVVLALNITLSMLILFPPSAEDRCHVVG